MIVYPTTALGEVCRATCREYNGCGNGGGEFESYAMRPMGSETSSSVCKDGQGMFFNHLANPKSCEWLFNDKPGLTDRKDKNCGFESYLMTELGNACPQTCSPYTNDNNGCSEPDVRGELAMMSSTSSLPCHDGQGLYLNHLSNPKTCEWLFNEKEGMTDRKSKNCGSGNHLVTELGLACPQTCSLYHSGSGCQEVAMMNGGHILRSFTTPNYSYSLTSPEISTECMDAEGNFMERRNTLHTCTWLAGVGNEHQEVIAKHRQDKNCGSVLHPEVSELGEMCPWTCKEYNGCSL